VPVPSRRSSETDAFRDLSFSPFFLTWRKYKRLIRIPLSAFHLLELRCDWFKAIWEKGSPGNPRSYEQDVRTTGSSLWSWEIHEIVRNEELQNADKHTIE
jgi:hypothetical protein